MTDDARQRQLELDWTREAERRSPAGLGLADDEARVLRVLERHHGRERALVSRELAGQAGVDARRLRTILRHLVIHHLVAVGAATGSPAGYYLITSEDERTRVRDGLFGRALRILQRARAFDRAGIADRLVGQLRMFDDGSDGED